MKTSYEKFMASSAVNPIELGEHKVELGKIDDLNRELNANSKQLDNLIFKFKEVRTDISILSQSYAYLSGQYSSMKNIAMDLGDSKLTGDIVKSLNASNAAYKQLNDIYQKIK
jgi:hypothetical protein